MEKHCHFFNCHIDEGWRVFEVGHVKKIDSRVETLLREQGQRKEPIKPLRSVRADHCPAGALTVLAPGSSRMSELVQIEATSPKQLRFDIDVDTTIISI